ncbi:polysulfide reductase NrfD [bacterium]|nr:polysulfide reductase NrfD [bacterium]
MKTNKNSQIFYWVLVGVMVAVGAVGLYWRLTTGHLMANYGQLIVWGLWVVMYTFLVGIAAGSFMVAALYYTFGIERVKPLARIALLTSLVSLPLGLLSIWFDLGHMSRFAGTIFSPNFKSMLPIEVWLYAAFLVVVAVMLWLVTKNEAKSQKTLKILSIVGFVLVILFESAGGAIYGLDKARASWHGSMIPFEFLLTAFLVGAAVVTGIYLLTTRSKEEERDASLVANMGKLMLGLVIASTVISLTSIFVAFYSDVPAEIEPLQSTITGPLWFIFWIGEILFGIVVPLVLLSLKNTRGTAFGVGFAGLGIVLGELAVRWNLIVPALALPELEGLVEATPSPRISTFYVPSTMEWFVTIGILGLGLAAFALGSKWFLPQTQEGTEVLND